MRLRLVPETTNVDFFSRWKLWFGISLVLIVLAMVSFGVRGLNFGIDFRGGTTIRTESTTDLDIGAYRDALQPLGLGDVLISEVFDPSFGDDRHVAMIRIQAQGDEEAISAETIQQAQAALQAVVPDIKFISVESVGPKVSGELIQTAVIAVLLALGAVLIYIWLRFELAIIAALLTIVGYSLNDTVVVYDRVRENLRKYKQRPLKEVLNMSINETLSRTTMTSFTTLLALFALFALGGDVIRGFVFAMIWGVVVGTYSSVFIAAAILLYFGVKRDWTKPDNTSGNQFANIDA